MGEAAEQRARSKQLKQPLEVEIVGGELSITIGLDTLALAMHASPTWPTDESGNITYQIIDAELFAEDFLRELKREEEDGTTPLHRLFDRVGLEALEQGADGVEEVSSDSSANLEARHNTSKVRS